MVGFRSSRLAYAALLLMAMLWGSTLIVMKNAYARMDPTSLLSSRFIMAALTFGIVFPKAGRPREGRFAAESSSASSSALARFCRPSD